MKKIIFLLFTYFIISSYANALIKVDITRGNLDPLPIAVSPLHVENTSEILENLDTKKLGLNISSIIEKNFKSTGLFNPLKERHSFKSLT